MFSSSSSGTLQSEEAQTKACSNTCLDMLLESSRIPLDFAKLFLDDPNVKVLPADADPEIDPFVSDNIRVSDTLGELKMYHYISCDDESDQVTKGTRGVARAKGRVVMKAFNYTPEYVSDKEDCIRAVLDPIFASGKKNFYFTRAEEGTLLRVWYYGKNWHVSSFKKLDASKSYWGSKESHKDVFIDALVARQEKADGKREDVLRAFLETLRKDRIYTFTVRSTAKNRVVCLAPEKPTVYFSGEFSAVGREPEFALLEGNTSGIPAAEKLDFEDSAGVLSYLGAWDPLRSQGLLVYYDVGTSEFGSIKLTNKAYQELVDVRDNVPSIRFRYLQLRTDPEKVKQFVELYPERVDELQECENMLYEIAEEIYYGYLRRFVYRLPDGSREQFTLPQEQWFVAKDLHDLYVYDPEACKISPQLVIDYIDSLPPVRVNHLIKGFETRSANAAGEKPDVPAK